MRRHTPTASRLPYGGFAGLDPVSVPERGRGQAEGTPGRGEIELLFEERPLDKSRSFRNDRVIAETAGVMLEATGMDSTNAIDAFVVATAAQLPVAVILTVDVDDVASLAASLRHVEVQALA